MGRVGVVVTGFPGSGSTTLGQEIARRFGWPPPYYSGGVVRWLIAKLEAAGQNAVFQMSPAEIMRAMEEGQIALQPQLTAKYKLFPLTLDRLVDDVQKELLEKKDYGVHEGRIAWFLARALHQEGRAHDKKFLSICCVVDPDVGARRLMGRPEYQGREAMVGEVRHEAGKRVAIERERYRTLYGIEDHLDPKNFDIVINTTDLSKETVCRTALRELKRLHPELLVSGADDYQI